MNYPVDFIEELSEAFPREIVDRYLSSEDNPVVSVRRNPRKLSKEEFEAHFSRYAHTYVPWCDDALYLADRPYFTGDPLFQAGAYYVQEASSMYAETIDLSAFKGQSMVRILDLCAAPGGKSTLLSALMQKNGIENCVIVSNEVMKQRSVVLADNIARWGDSSVVVTSSDPSDFKKMTAYFDIILADMPCSGEGMFRKDDTALEQWSLDNVALCASRQRRIAADVWNSLRQGGIMIYSTCTFNRAENDENIAWICDELGAEVVRGTEDESGVSIDSDVLVSNGVYPSAGGGFHFVPGSVQGEGQYFAVVRKTSQTGRSVVAREGKQVKGPRFDILPEDYVFYADRDMLKALRPHVYAELKTISSFLKVIHSGVVCYNVKGRDYIPHPDLALCADFDASNFVTVDLDEETAMKFCARENFVLSGVEKGYVLLRCAGQPLGFVKNLGNRVNSLWPMSRRVLKRAAGVSSGSAGPV